MTNPDFEHSRSRIGSVADSQRHVGTVGRVGVDDDAAVNVRQ